jgi:hypothetical protein
MTENDDGLPNEWQTGTGSLIRYAEGQDGDMEAYCHGRWVHAETAEGIIAKLTRENENLKLQVRCKTETQCPNQPLIDDIERWRQEAEKAMTTGPEVGSAQASPRELLRAMAEMPNFSDYAIQIVGVPDNADECDFVMIHIRNGSHYTWGGSRWHLKEEDK